MRIGCIEHITLEPCTTLKSVVAVLRQFLHEKKGHGRLVGFARFGSAVSYTIQVERGGRLDLWVAVPPYMEPLVPLLPKHR